MRIAILEFAPCVDWIYHIRRDDEEGYLTSDATSVTIRSGVKLRPRVASVYAGGKATNVARVMDRLLREEDNVEVELLAFLPDSAEGRYLYELQESALKRVRVRRVGIEGQARLCIDLLDPATPQDERVAFNISPRAVWTAGAYDTALRCAKEVTADLLLMAGNPPLLQETGELAVDLYTDVMKTVRHQVGAISLDTEKQTLANALQARVPPAVIKINASEEAGIADSLWQQFRGTKVVTDLKGCRVREGDNPETWVPAAHVERLYSTIGAGDAVHAAFTLARWVWGFDVVQAARYGQAAAAATVSAPDGTRDVTKSTVNKFFAQWQNR